MRLILVITAFAVCGCGGRATSQSGTVVTPTKGPRPPLQGIMRLRIEKDPIVDGGVKRYLAKALPALDTNGGEDGFILTIHTANAGSSGNPRIRQVTYYTCHVTVYRNVTIDGRKGKFVVYEDSQPKVVLGEDTFLGKFESGKDSLAEGALRGFIKEWKATNLPSKIGAQQPDQQDKK